MPSYSQVDHLMMKRCLHLAQMGGYHVGNNPMVGAVITYNDRIIGEGYHRYFGGPHAEIEAISSIKKRDLGLLPQSHLYVSLEPCNHHGKTPPCVDALLAARIPLVTICNIDPNPIMSGKSVIRMKEQGLQVKVGLRKEDGLYINRKFFIRQDKKMPFVVLKWAQSKDGYIGRENEQIRLSNQQSNLLVHKWREELDAIMVGTNTVITDNPQLTNRRGRGRSPARIVIDRKGRIPLTSKIFTDQGETVVFTELENYQNLGKNKRIFVMKPEEWQLQNILSEVHKSGIGSLLVEGGRQLLLSFIHDNLWHEARVIHTPVKISSGIKAPYLSGKISDHYNVTRDKILIINNLKINQRIM